MGFMQILPLFLLGALALVMFGLGLSLTMADFRRLSDNPKAVFIALGLQVVVLPLICFAIARGLGLSPVFAVGLMLLAASPGGISANLFSHLFGGNVAMNISLTAINTLLSIVTLPLIVNLSIAHFMGDGGQVVQLQWSKVLEVVVVIVVPVTLGMILASRRPTLATRAEKPFKLFSALVLAAFALIAIVKESGALAQSLGSIGPAVVLFNVVSLCAGYFVSLAAGVDKPVSTAIAFEIGIHNSTLAIYIAASVLNNFELSLPAALYSISMYVIATLFGTLVLRRGRQSPSLKSSG
ncbi:MAG: bile acid:sodium symporter family protein [Pseudomonadota bacterium]|nr:bile acid:sodium symporter family protein [Pseudomonadota bacterium]